MIYFIFGPDTYRSRAKLNQLIKQDSPNREVERVTDGESIKLGEFKQKILANNLLSPKKLVIFEKVMQNKEQAEITSFLKETKLPSEDILIFFEEKVDKKLLLYKFLKEKAEIFELAELTEEKIKQWLMDYIKQRGGKIEPAAIKELLFLTHDLWFLSRELDKLIAYQKNITLANVQLLTPAGLDDNIFNLTDALGSRQQPLALKLISEQLATGVEPLYLLSMIIRQFRILLQLREAMERTRFVNYQTLAQELKLHPYVVQKTLGQAQKYTLEQLKKIYQQLEKLDLKLKSSKLSAESLLTRFIIN